MNGALSKEQRRNLAKAVGATAVEMLEGVQQQFRNCQVQLQAVAKHLQTLEQQLTQAQGLSRTDIKNLQDVVPALENQMKHEILELQKELSAAEAHVFHMVQKPGLFTKHFTRLTFLGRLRWFCTGHVAGLVLPDPGVLNSFNAPGGSRNDGATAGMSQADAGAHR